MRKLFLALTLVSSLAVSSPFNGNWATSSKACKASAERLEDGQFKLTITPKVVKMIGYNFVHSERIEEVFKSDNRNFIYSGHYQEMWEGDNSSGTADTRWTLNNGILKSSEAPVKFIKCK